MKKFYIFLIFALCSLGASAQWTQIITDATGDGVNNQLLDGTLLEYRYDVSTDSLYFRFSVTDLSASSGAMGMNVMINIPGASGTFNFWGAQNMDAFHKLLTVWVTGTFPSTFSGTIGIADAAGVMSNMYTNLSANNISIYADVLNNEITIGLARKDFIADSELMSGSATVAIAGAVGSNLSWNDDLYAARTMITINTIPSGIENQNLDDLISHRQQAGTNILNISLDSSIETIKLVDVKGALVYSSTPNRLALNARVELPEPGVYFMIAHSKEGLMFSKKILAVW